MSLPAPLPSGSVIPSWDSFAKRWFLLVPDGPMGWKRRYLTPEELSAIRAAADADSEFREVEP